jgi:hypothetical protein
MNENDLAQQIMDDDGAGSAITSIPAGQRPCCQLHDPFCGQGPKRYEGYPCHLPYRPLPDPVHHGDIFSRIDASTAGER